MELRGRITILDGGLGTTLENIYGKKIAGTPVWSAQPITDDPESIISAHLLFLKAGARIIQTSTYQCSTEAFKREGYTPVEAERIMIKSVELANEARDRFLAEHGCLSRQDIGIALSLGPFGASQSPSCEFTGCYPPPYGPDGQNFSNPVDTDTAVDALTLFHLERLIVFGRSDVWDMVDFVAFETIPLLREIRAIKRAMGQFQSGISGEGRNNKPPKLWWISSTFPDGNFPELIQHGGQTTAMSNIVAEVMGENVEDGSDGTIPAGIGINCTPIEAIPRLLEDMKQAVLLTRQNPLLVVYPGGDRNERSEGVKDGGKEKCQSWSEKLWSIARSSAEDNVWGGVVVGGCCMIDPNMIQELAENLRNGSPEQHLSMITFVIRL